MSERACNKCGELKADSEYSVVDKASGRRGPTCKTCKASATKARRKPAGRDAERHEAMPAEPSVQATTADEARPEADNQRPEADEALVGRAIEVLVKSAPLPRFSGLPTCRCGRYQLLPGHAECLRCSRFC